MDRRQKRAEIAVIAIFAACGLALIAWGVFGLTGHEPMDVRVALAVAGAAFCVFAARFAAVGRESSASLFSLRAAHIVAVVAAVAAGFSMLRLLMGLDLITSLIAVAVSGCLSGLRIYLTKRGAAHSAAVTAQAPPQTLTPQAAPPTIL